MNFLEFVKQNWAEIFALTREHIFLVFVSTALAVLIGVPLGILLTRKKSLQTPVLGIANISADRSVACIVRAFDSDFVYRHRRESRDYRADALFVFADYPKYRDGNFRR